MKKDNKIIKAVSILLFVGIFVFVGITSVMGDNKGTLERAKYILENGCDAYYDYPPISWSR